MSHDCFFFVVEINMKKIPHQKNENWLFFLKKKGENTFYFLAPFPPPPPFFFFLGRGLEYPST